MNDCVNAEMRDRLPDLLNDRLPANERAEVVAHVAACADCREELDLLRGLRSALSAPVPHVDVARVVNALPKPSSHATGRARRRTWADWRIAAAITVLVVGGSSVALINRGGHISQVAVEKTRSPITDTPSTPGRTVGSVAKPGTPDRGARPGTPSDTNQDGDGGGLGMSGHLSDLDDAQLQALINEIEEMKAVPITEPEPVSIKVGMRNVSNPGLR
jgi:anti-sigma factor RsiW